MEWFVGICRKRLPHPNDGQPSRELSRATDGQPLVRIPLLLNSYKVIELKPITDMIIYLWLRSLHNLVNCINRYAGSFIHQIAAWNIAVSLLTIPHPQPKYNHAIGLLWLPWLRERV